MAPVAALGRLNGAGRAMGLASGLDGITADFGMTGANGVTLRYSRTENPPVGQWTTVTAPITAGSLTLTNGQPATEAQIRSVLANVQATNIRTEYFSNGETIAFGNIRCN